MPFAKGTDCDNRLGPGRYAVFQSRKRLWQMRLESQTGETVKDHYTEFTCYFVSNS
jgi:hypothetical protein